MSKIIAVPVNDDNVLDGHFGHCRFFAIYSVNDDDVELRDKLVPPPHEPGLLPKWLSEKGITDLIAGGVGQRAIELFNQKGVNVFVGAPQMSAEELVRGYLDGTLSFTANYCNH